MIESTIYSAAIGINNTVVSHRLPFNVDSGVSALMQATDVLIDPTGEIVTRRGNSLLETGSFHSGYKCDNGFYAIKDRDNDSALYKVILDSAGQIVDLFGIRSKLTMNAGMAFVPYNNGYLYCNGYENGFLEGAVSTLWPVNDWPGPDKLTHSKTETPIGSHVDILSGRVLVTVANELFYSEYGLVGLVDEIGNRVRMEGNIIMVCAVQSGVYISDTKAVYFLAGINPKDWICKKVLNYPAVEWAINHELVDPSDFGFDSYQLAGLFGTINGPVMGLPSGTPENLIDKVLTLSDCKVSRGAITVVDKSMIIQTGE